MPGVLQTDSQAWLFTRMPWGAGSQVRAGNHNLRFSDTKTEEGAPASLLSAPTLCTLSAGHLGPQRSHSPMVSALLKWQLSTLVGSLFSQSFSSSKYTSTLQCLTNRPCSTTWEQEAGLTGDGAARQGSLGSNTARQCQRAESS